LIEVGLYLNLRLIMEIFAPGQASWLSVAEAEIDHLGQQASGRGTGPSISTVTSGF
jgi:hypothetical protein